MKTRKLVALTAKNIETALDYYDVPKIPAILSLYYKIYLIDQEKDEMDIAYLVCKAYEKHVQKLVNKHLNKRKL